MLSALILGNLMVSLWNWHSDSLSMMKDALTRALSVLDNRVLFRSASQKKACSSSHYYKGILDYRENLKRSNLCHPGSLPLSICLFLLPLEPWQLLTIWGVSYIFPDSLFSSLASLGANKNYLHVCLYAGCRPEWLLLIPPFVPGTAPYEKYQCVDGVY